LGGDDQRLLDQDVGDDYRAMAKQFHHVDGHRQTLGLSQGRVLYEAIGIGDLHPINHRHGLAAEPEGEMLHRDLAPECRRCLTRD
jgi:hypothetical protein